MLCSRRLYTRSVASLGIFNCNLHVSDDLSLISCLSFEECVRLDVRIITKISLPNLSTYKHRKKEIRRRHLCLHPSLARIFGYFSSRTSEAPAGYGNAGFRPRLEAVLLGRVLEAQHGDPARSLPRSRNGALWRRKPERTKGLGNSHC